MYKSSNLTLMVSNLEQAIQFYVEKLGLTLKSQQGEHWAEVQAPGLTIGLHPGGEAGTSPTPQPKLSIGFEVEDLEQAITLLQNKGVEVDPNLNEGKATRLAYFSDPDQTPLYLYQAVKSTQNWEGTKVVPPKSGSSNHMGALEEHMSHIKPPVVTWPPSNDPNEEATEKTASSNEMTPG